MKVEFKGLGYSDKWLEYGFIDERILDHQYAEFRKGNDRNIEHYRYRSFSNWLSKKEKFTDSEIENFIELATEDNDQLMAGSAVKLLFSSPQISGDQFDLIRQKLPAFGDWTTKLIRREVLVRRIRKEKLTQNLVAESILYSREFKENILVRLIIEKTDDPDLIAEFTKSDYGKKVRNLANEKLNGLT